MPPASACWINRRFVALVTLALIGTLTAADDRPAGARMREQVLRMTDFLDTTLPGVLGAQNIALQLKPKFADLRHEEYMRFPLELRYGLTDRTELLGGLVPFTPNPFNRGRDHRWGDRKSVV